MTVSLLRPVASSSAAVAADASPGRVHQYHPPASFCRFAGEDGGELRPARIQDRPVQPGLGAGTVGKELAGALRVGPGHGTSGHPGRVQVLQRDHVALADQCPRGFVAEVAATVADRAPFPGQGALEAPAVTRPGPGPGHAALQVRDDLRRGGQEPRTGHDLAVAGGQEPGHAQVHADLAPGRGQRHRLGVGDHDDVPAAVLPAQLQRLDRAAHRPVLTHLDRAHRLEGGIRPRAGAARLPFRAVPGDEQDLAEPLVRLEPRIARLVLPPRDLRGPDPVEVRGEHRAEPAQGLLLGGERVAALPVRVRPPDVLELGGLHAVGNADAPRPPGLAALGQRGVVQVTVVGQQPHRAALLGPRGIGAELEGSSHQHRLRVVGVSHRPPRLPPGRAICTQIVWPGTDISGLALEGRVCDTSVGVPHLGWL